MKIKSMSAINDKIYGDVCDLYDNTFGEIPKGIKFNVSLICSGVTSTDVVGLTKGSEELQITYGAPSVVS
jgi:hypothetical protein